MFFIPFSNYMSTLNIASVDKWKLIFVSFNKHNVNEGLMILKIKYKKFFGFSLAEVLIALVVIGIVSAITVPTLMASYQKNVTIEKLKKVHSTFAQVSNRIISDNGGHFCNRHNGLECLLFLYQDVKNFKKEGWVAFSKEYLIYSDKNESEGKKICH